MRRCDDLESIRLTALDAVEPSCAVRRYLESSDDTVTIGGTVWHLPADGTVRLVAVGKAAVPMARAAAEVLGERVRGGVVVTRRGQGGGAGLPERLSLFEAGHPVPDAAGLAATEAVEHLLQESGEGDVVLALLSGGASALMADPAPGLTLEDLGSTTEVLLRSGAAIGELNAVRKHLSRLKGGQLARLAWPARLGALILSDVVGDPLDVIASGPTSPDPSTFDDAWDVLERRGLLEAVPEAVGRHLRVGREGGRTETPKPGDPVFEQVVNVVVGSCVRAAEAAARAAAERSYNTLVLTTFVEGEAREVAKVAAALAKGVLAHGHPAPQPACLIWGGETTVTVKGNGKGGRNQELALAAALALDGVPGVSILALATDGSDGPTDASGAIVDGTTAAAIRAAGIDPARSLAENDAYPALAACGALLRTGPTGTNVNDLLVILVGDVGSRG
jgi:hydroxypyruvate reductase